MQLAALWCLLAWGLIVALVIWAHAAILALVLVAVMFVGVLRARREEGPR